MSCLVFDVPSLMNAERTCKVGLSGLSAHFLVFTAAQLTCDESENESSRCVDTCPGSVLALLTTLYMRECHTIDLGVRI